MSVYSEGEKQQACRQYHVMGEISAEPSSQETSIHWGEEEKTIDVFVLDLGYKEPNKNEKRKKTVGERRTEEIWKSEKQKNK